MIMLITMGLIVPQVEVVGRALVPIVLPGTLVYQLVMHEKGQPANALLPMLLTLLGITIDDRPEQPLNADSAMVVTVVGIITDVREVH